MKYPKTLHLPWSKGITKEDKVIDSADHLIGKNVVILEKMDGECFSGSTKILMGDYSHTHIRTLVKNKLIGSLVKGKNANGAIVNTPILNVFENGSTEDWLKVHIRTPNGGPCRVTYVTPEHKYFQYNSSKEICAADLATGTVLTFAKPQLGLTPTQKQILLGKLLGDGSLHIHYGNSATVQFSHKEAHKPYIEYTNSVLGGIATNNTATYVSGFGTKMVKTWTKTTHTIYKLFSKMINNDTKQVPTEIASELDPIALAFWLMDDGSLAHSSTQRDRIVFSTYAFSRQSCDNLVAKLHSMGINSSVMTDGSGYNYIYVSADSTPLLATMVAPYIPPSMRYKLPIEFRGLEYDTILPDNDIMITHELPVEVTKIEKKPHRVERVKYDIETGTHNYFANNILVHNCTSMYVDHIHTRSEDSGHHPSRSWVKNFWGEISHRIPEDVQICGENLYAKHSIYYDNLASYFYGFLVIKKDMVLSWPDTIRLFEEVGITPVPTICFGPLSNIYIQNSLINPKFKPFLGEEMEGYVIRPIEEFPVKDFSRNVLKYVRKNHVKTDKHWTKEWVKNGLGR